VKRSGEGRESVVKNKTHLFTSGRRLLLWEFHLSRRTLWEIKGFIFGACTSERPDRREEEGTTDEETRRRSRK
jgi:hypothetical protein